MSKVDLEDRILCSRSKGLRNRMDGAITGKKWKDDSQKAERTSGDHVHDR